MEDQTNIQDFKIIVEGEETTLIEFLNDNNGEWDSGDALDVEEYKLLSELRPGDKIYLAQGIEVKRPEAKQPAPEQFRTIRLTHDEIETIESTTENATYKNQSNETN